MVFSRLGTGISCVALRRLTDAGVDRGLSVSTVSLVTGLWDKFPISDGAMVTAGRAVLDIRHLCDILIKGFTDIQHSKNEQSGKPRRKR